MPLDRESVEALGRRLERARSPQSADLEELASLQSAYLPSLEVVTGRLRDLFGTPPVFEGVTLTATSRVKTVATIVEKLRHHETSLASMRDVVGVRIVGDFRRRRQDQIVGLVVSAFAVRPNGIIDRRRAPREGYRAVHVVAEVDGYPVEIQVRTLVQHLWANGMERIADMLGRQVRYGRDPSAATPAQLEHRRQFLAAYRAQADAQDAWEIEDDLATAAYEAAEDALEAFGSGMIPARRLEEVRDAVLAQMLARRQAAADLDLALARVTELVDTLLLVD